MTTKQGEKLNKVDVHYAMAREKRARVQELRDELVGEGEKLKDLNARYKAAVAAGSDVEVNKLFDQIEKTQKALRAGRHKLGTLEEVTEDLIRNDAVETVKGYEEQAYKHHVMKTLPIFQQLKDEKEKYLVKVRALLSQIAEVKDDFEDIRAAYSSLVGENQIENADLEEHHQRASLLRHIQNDGSPVGGRSIAEEARKIVGLENGAEITIRDLQKQQVKKEPGEAMRRHRERLEAERHNQKNEGGHNE